VGKEEVGENVGREETGVEVGKGVGSEVGRAGKALMRVYPSRRQGTTAS